MLVDLPDVAVPDVVDIVTIVFGMDPRELIPHRDPFLFLDEITELVPKVSAKAIWTPPIDWPNFSGHFPGRPTLPGVVMVESVAQLGAAAVLASPDYEGKLPLFGGIDRARFRRQVVPGDTLELEVELVSLSARAGKGKGTASVQGKVACEVELFFVIA